jgi:hypothetical protein
MGKVKSDLSNLKDGSASTGSAMDYSFTEARGSMMLLGEEIGVRVPRHLQTLIASIGPIGSAFAAILPVVGVVAAIAVLEKVKDKIQEARDKVATFGVGWAEATSTSVDKVGALDVEILKLRDETAKLYGKPATNGPAEAAIEALGKMMNLDKGIITTISDMEKLMKEQSIGTFDSLLTGKAGTGDIEAALKPKMDAVKSAFAEVLNAESQLELDTINNASRTTLASDQAILAAKKSAAAQALELVHAEAAAQQQSLDARVAAQVKAAGHIDASQEEQQAFLAKQTQEFRAQQSTAQQLVTSVQQQTTALQVQLGLETALTKATKDHGDAEAAHAGNEATKKANLEKLQSWDAASKAAQKYKGTLASVTAEEEKRGHMGPSPEDLASIAAVDPLMASALDSTKKQGQELSELHTYYEQLAEAEKNVAKAQEEQNATLKTDAIERQIEAYKQLASEGLISQQELAARLKPLYQQETDDKIAAIKAGIEEQQAIELAALSSGDAIKADRAKTDEIKLQTQLEQIRQKGVAQQAALDIKQGADFQKMATQETQAWNNAVTNWIVNGGRFSEEMRKVGAKMLTDVMNYAVQETIVKEEQWAIQKVKKLLFGVSTATQTIATNKTEAVAAAGLAGANMMASVALAPWPIDMTAPAQAAAAVSEAMSLAAFEQGGKIPGLGAVPILAHGGETVVTKALTDRVERAESRGNTYGDTHVHATFAPSYSGMDAGSVEGMLKTHNAVFQREIRSTMRKMNR